MPVHVLTNINFGADNNLKQLLMSVFISINNVNFNYAAVSNYVL